MDKILSVRECSDEVRNSAVDKSNETLSGSLFERMSERSRD